nr:terminase small subunit protein [Sulfitobacter sp. 20_GPM-1509m]
MTLREICRAEDMPPESTVRLWALDDREGFSAHYTRAREIGYHVMADELMEIADDGRNDFTSRNAGDAEAVLNGEHIQRSRLRVDTRKWMLSKVLPKIYGDKLDLNHGGGLKVTISGDDADL